MRKKFKFKLLNNSGYLQIDLAFTLLIFILLLFLIFNLYSYKMLEYNNNINLINLNSYSKDLCKLLISSSGSPSNWEDDISKINYLGLTKVNSKNLSSEKLNVLTNNNYLKIISNLNKKYLYSIKIYNVLNGSLLVNFGYSNSTGICSKYICYSNFKGSLVGILVGVCK